MHIYKPSHVPVKLESEYCHSYKDSMVLCNILLVTNYYYSNDSFHDRHEASLDVTWSISTYMLLCWSLPIVHPLWEAEKFLERKLELCNLFMLWQWAGEIRHK